MKRLLLVVALSILNYPVSQPVWSDTPSAAGTAAIVPLSAATMQARGLQFDRANPPNYVEAMAWWRRAAAAGDARAMSDIGTLYAEGHGAPQDYTAAMAWFRKGADAGYAGAMYNVGLLYYDGHGVPLDYTKAMAWYRRTVNAGFITAMNDIGVMYDIGQGVPQDYTKAMACFQRAAAAGNAYAMSSIGYMYGSGHGVVQNYAEALAWYRKAAGTGDAAGMYNVGVAYDHGEGIPQDYTAAMAWFRKAAAKGYAAAMYDIAIHYGKGEGVALNAAKMLIWLRKAIQSAVPGSDIQQVAEKALQMMTHKNTVAVERKAASQIVASGLRQGIVASPTEIITAEALHKAGWVYVMPQPKSPEAAWGNYDGRTTWWNGGWFNKGAKEFSTAQPVINADGSIHGDGMDWQGWRRGGSPTPPSRIEWLCSLAPTNSH